MTKKIFKFPDTTGKHAVGTCSYHWIDEKRAETHSENPDDRRELMVQFWYPTTDEIGKDATEPYYPHEIPLIKKEIQREVGKALKDVSDFDTIRTHTTTDAPVLNGKYPVIIYSHGYSNARTDSAALCANLASHGYVVIGIGHTYSCRDTKFSDGRVVPFKMSDFAQDAISDQEMNIWVQDISFVIDRLVKGIEQFDGKLDLANIGVFGHSFGGGAAVQACRKDKRISACVGMDAALFGKQGAEGFAKPVLLLRAKQSYVEPIVDTRLKMIKMSRDDYNRITKTVTRDNDIFYNALTGDAYKVVITDADHTAFCDYALFKMLPALQETGHNLRVGTIDGFRVTEIVRAYLVAFFNQYLKKQESALLSSQASPYLEVEYESKKVL